MIWRNSNIECFESVEERNTWVFVTLLELLEPWRIICLLANAPKGIAKTINSLTVDDKYITGSSASRRQIDNLHEKACVMNDYDKVDAMLMAFELDPFWNSDISSIVDIPMKDINERRKQLQELESKRNEEL